ncbi:MAG: hypothetical protein ABI353_18340 [Isosphaeraceae bacterium]
MSRPISRFTLANLLILIGLIAAELGALRAGTDFAERLSFTFTLAALAVGLLGALVRRGDAAWIGFALFGWGCALLYVVPSLGERVNQHLITTELLDEIVVRLHPQVPELALPTFNNAQVTSSMGEIGNIIMFNKSDFPYRNLLSPAENKALDNYFDQRQSYDSQMMAIRQKQRNSRRVGQSLLTLILALIGAVLGRFLGNRRESVATNANEVRGVDVAHQPITSGVQSL